MIFSLLKLKFIQILLFVNRNLKYIFTSFLAFLSICTISIFGFWNLFSGFYHLIMLIFLLCIIFLLFYYMRNKFCLVSFKTAVTWLEKKNFRDINPFSAIKDKPVGRKFNSLMWRAHIQQTQTNMKNLIFYYPKVSFERVDPLKIRVLFILFFLLSVFWGYSNKVIEKNLTKLFEVNLEKKDKFTEKFNMQIWAKPPVYTGLPQKSIDLSKLLSENNKNILLPFASEIIIKTYGSHSNAVKIMFGKENKYDFKKGVNVDLSYTLEKSQKIKFEIDQLQHYEAYLKVIDDKKPVVKFISSPATVNGVSLKFLTESRDDYGIVNAVVAFSKPKSFDHFLEDELIYDLNFFKDDNNKIIKNLFFKNLSSHIWAGSKATLKVTVYDDLKQEGSIATKITLPEKDFSSSIAKNIYITRAELAKKNISPKKAKAVIEKLFTESKKLLHNDMTSKKYQEALLNLNNVKELPLSYNNRLYSSLWELALAVEEGSFFSVKKNLEQIEQNLFDSINQRETEKISANIEDFKESVQSLLDIDNEGEENYFSNYEKNEEYRDQINKAAKDLEDLLKTGTKESLSEKIQELKQLTDSIKNPKKMSKNEILKEQQKKDFINKLSELLNKQEMIMEESFNEAANRGKFKQSSEGSGGRTSKEKQDNLRNTLGNIMRDIGESENEIPQELGRADRAMRQATRELENGRPDQASNAQGRATEMIRRAMNRIRDDNSKKLSKLSSEDMNIKSSEKEINFSEADNDLEYQGTALGGTVEIPKSVQIQKAQKIAKELYSRYNQKERSKKEKEYIKSLLDWY